jgi:hypothetical protein
MDFYDIQDSTNAGTIRSMEEWHGQGLLVANTASPVEYKGSPLLQDRFGSIHSDVRWFERMPSACSSSPELGGLALHKNSRLDLDIPPVN